MDTKWKTIKEYESGEGLKIGSRHANKGLIVITVYLVKKSNDEYYIAYTYDITRVIKYPVRLAYFLLYPLLPLSIILQMFFSGDKPYITKQLLKEAHKSYWKFYKSNDLTKTIDARNIYSDWNNIPVWVNRKELESCIDYAKGFLKYSSIPYYKRRKLMEKYIGLYSPFAGASSIVIANLAKHITVPEEFIRKHRKLAEDDIKNEEEDNL